MDGLAWAALVLWAAAFLARLLRDSLRNFSRTHLERLCRDRGVESRFGEILDGDEQAELMAASASLLLTVGASACTALSFLRSPAGGVWWGWVAGGVGLSLVLLLAWVMLPLAVSRVAGDRVVLAAWPVLSKLLVAFRPFQVVAGGIRTVIQRLSGRKPPEENSGATGELDAAVVEANHGGAIEGGVSRMIKRVMELAGADANDIMTPRTDFNSLPVDTPIDEARSAFMEFGHSRIPVTGDSPDEILGVVYAKDLLHVEEDRAGENGEPAVPEDDTLRSLLRPPFFVPETKRVDNLLEEMKTERTHLAIVLDEYGGVVGLVTLEDILEEIVGNIADEYDPEDESELFQRVDDRTIEIEGRTRIDELNRELDLGLPDDNEYETIGGFVTEQLDHLPVAGESLIWQGREITVTEAVPQRIVKVHLADAAEDE